MSQMKRILLTIISGIILFLTASASELRLPAYISDNMVLQQNETVNIWGWAAPSARISVKAEWMDRAVKAKADDDGKWMVQLSTPSGGYTGYSMTVTDGKTELEVRDILFGEVWLCSGQSNMAWRTDKTTDLEYEMANASKIASGIRIFSTGRISAETPQDDVPGARWKRCNPKSVATFSAVGYGFGLELQKALDVPIGLVQAAYGGTYLEGWVPEEAFESHEKSSYLQKASKIMLQKSKKWGGKDSHLYNANIHPLVNVRFAGVIWYQGCANVTINPVTYRHTLSLLIDVWRKELCNPQLPFYIVQIAPHTYSDMEGALLRESQAYVAAHVSNTALVVTNDCQDIPGDIHPRLKRNVFHRLALCALGQHYGKDVGEWRSPEFDRYEVIGNQIKLHFKYLPTAFKVVGDRIIGFQIAGKGKSGNLEYFLADAALADDGKSVVLSSPEVALPAGARYCFDESVGSLFSAEGLPLNPFRTDRTNKPLAPSARAYMDKPFITSVTFEGDGYEKITLSEGAGFWTNNEMTLFENSYPVEFEGFEALVSETVAKGDLSKGGRYIANEDGRVYFLAKITSEVRKAWNDGWRLLVPASFQLRRQTGLNDDGTPNYKVIDGFYINYRDVRKGETVNLPTTDSWSSVIPLAARIDYLE